MKTRFWLLLVASLGMTPLAGADVLDLPSEESAPQPVPSDTLSFTLPGRGMTKDQVEERFGTPEEKISPIGEPPISRWIYGNFTVYFEYDHVVHAVLHKH